MYPVRQMNVTMKILHRWPVYSGRKVDADMQAVEEGMSTASFVCRVCRTRESLEGKPYTVEKRMRFPLLALQQNKGVRFGKVFIEFRKCMQHPFLWNGIQNVRCQLDKFHLQSRDYLE